MKRKILLRRAERLAHQTHSNDKRIISGTPYINHPLAVARRLKRLRFSKIIIAAGWLHDCVEDHPDACSFEDLENALDCNEVDHRMVTNVVNIVRAVTYDPSYSSRRGRMERYREAVVANPDAIPVALADKADNAADIVTHLNLRMNVFGANYLNCDPREEIRNWLAIVAICLVKAGHDHRIKTLCDEVVAHAEFVKRTLSL